MAEVERTAPCAWTGDLTYGQGTPTVESGALLDQPVTSVSRAGRPYGKTSPEELMAAGRAACCAMALSLVLG